MEHSYAIENHTAERYLLEELEETEREAYEEHFFSCPACAEEIKSASEFLDTARRVVEDELRAQIYTQNVRNPGIWGSWLNWRSILQPIPAMACALFLLAGSVVTYQNVATIPSLKHTAAAVRPQPTLTAEIIPPNAFKLGEARDSAATSVVNTRRGEAFTLQFDVTLTAFDSYEAGIFDASGLKRLSLRVISADEAKDPVRVLVPGGALQSGSYSVRIQGTSNHGTESGVKGKTVVLPFQLNIQD